MSKALKRVAITGMGAICGLGHDLKEVWKKAIDGASGVSTLTNVDPTNYPAKFGGEVKDFQISDQLIPEKEQKRYDKFIHYAVHSAHQALGQANILHDSPYSPERMGVILGVGLGGFPMIEENCRIFAERGARRVSPFFIPGVIPSMTSGLISIKFGLQGANYSIASACASSAHAISSAALEIMVGSHDVIVSGGAEAVLTALPISGFANMKAISKRNDEPERASRPFDIDRDGFVMGEGAGILVLENLEKAIGRGATIYGEILGYGSTSDTYHITAPHPEGKGAIVCMKRALEMASISLEEIGYINTHGTATPLGDIAEVMAVKQTFGEHAKNLYISSTKSMTGHLLGAAGGLESIFSVLALHEGILPPTINLDNQDPKCDLNCIPNKARSIQVEHSLNNSFGFGGTNSSIIFKRFS